VGHHVRDVVGHLGIVVVEGHERPVALEADGLAAVVPAEPAALRGVRPVLQGGDEARVGAPDVVEDAVEEHAHAALVGGGEQGVQVGVVAEPRVDPEVVDGVVAVRLGCEHRAEREPVRAEPDEVVEPVDEDRQPVLHRAVTGSGLLGAEEAERVHVPPDHVLGP
jgi:hypothetical protein